MVEIISKRDGPRREDVQLRRLLERNRATIERLADHLSNGRYSAGKAAAAAPSQGTIVPAGRVPATSDDPTPLVRVAVNGRVSVIDADTGRQLHHLGDIRRQDGVLRFRLATAANGFFAPVAAEVAERLADLDGRALDAAFGEPALVAGIGARLGLA